MTNQDVKGLTLEDVESYFNKWRAKPSRPRNIPDELWSEVVNLLSQHSVNMVVKTLEVNGQSLRMRAAAAGIKVKPAAKRKAKQPTFLETRLETIAGQTQGHRLLQEWNL